MPAGLGWMTELAQAMVQAVHHGLIFWEASGPDVAKMPVFNNRLDPEMKKAGFSHRLKTQEFSPVLFVTPANVPT